MASMFRNDCKSPISAPPATIRLLSLTSSSPVRRMLPPERINAGALSVTWVVCSMRVTWYWVQSLILRPSNCLLYVSNTDVLQTPVLVDQHIGAYREVFRIGGQQPFGVVEATRHLQSG